MPKPWLDYPGIVSEGDPIADPVKAILHDMMQTGLNIEQRKRLSIGVELVAKPELLLFLGMYTP